LTNHILDPGGVAAADLKIVDFGGDSAFRHLRPYPIHNREVKMPCALT
jgi:hypothetical protein